MRPDQPIVQDDPTQPRARLEAALAHEYSPFRGTQFEADVRSVLNAVDRVDQALTHAAVSGYLAELPWSSGATDAEKTLVAGNIRGFAQRLREHRAHTAPQERAR